MVDCNLSDATERSDCPIPATHRRLNEAHQLWHQTEAAYHDPVAFRANLNATIQACRNATWALQSEKHQIPGFDEWYAPIQEALRADPIMMWLNDARIQVVKKGDLETKSLARVTLKTWDEVDLGTLEAPPFLRADRLADYFGRQKALPIPPGFEEAVLCVERRWVVAQLPDRELLDVLAHCFGLYSNVVADGHRQAGKPTSCKVEAERPGCMSDCGEARMAFFHPAAERPLEAEVVAIPRRKDLLRKAAKRYALRGKAPAIRRPADVFAVAEWVNEVGKVILARDGNHVPMAFLCWEDRISRPIVIEIPDTESKFVAIRKIASEISRSRATGVVLINEVWWIPRDEYTGLRAGLSPNRREALSVLAAASDLRARSYNTPFTRNDLGRVSLGETEVTEYKDTDPEGILGPIFSVWRRSGASPSPPAPK